MAVRWQHGLLRLWFVASVCWLAAIWWLNIGLAPVARYILTGSDGQQYEMDAPDEQTAMSALEMYLQRRQSAPPSVEAPTQPQDKPKWGSDPIVLGSWKNYAPGAKGEANPSDESAPVPSSQDRLVTQASWAFGPPMAALIFGYIVGWIVLGFLPRRVG